MVERVLAKDEVAGSNPVSRSIDSKLIFLYSKTMSKKNRQKKKNKQKIQRKVEQFAPVENTETDEVDTASPLAKEEKKDISTTTIDEPTQKLISKDVRMIIFTLLGLALLLAAIKILDLKTDYISNLGNWLYKIANIQTM